MCVRMCIFSRGVIFPSILCKIITFNFQALERKVKSVVLTNALWTDAGSMKFKCKL